MKSNEFETVKYRDFSNDLDSEENGRIPDILALEQELRSDEEHPTSMIDNKSDENDEGSFRED
jgi:hypothetical protein